MVKTPMSRRLRAEERLRSRFISFEGGEGAGKGTMIKLLVERLKKKGIEVISTREPGGTPYAETIRDLIFDGKKAAAQNQEKIHGRTEVLLFCASRAQHVEHLIRPALMKGFVVVTDRFEDSTAAYQGAGRQLSSIEREGMYATTAYARQEIYPSLTILLDVKPEIGVARRLTARGGKTEVTRFDREKLDFHYRVRDAYRFLAKMDFNRWRVIDASRSKEEVFRDVWEAVRTHLTI